MKTHLLFPLAFLACAAPAAAQQANALASAPVDVTLFREGEVLRSNRVFGAWTLTCDEIPRMHQRYCSLAAPVLDAKGRSAATLVVSTGDDGRPAALLQTPLGVGLGLGAQFSITPGGLAGAVNGKGPRERHIDFVRCDRASCAAVWTLVPEEIVLPGAVIIFAPVIAQTRGAPGSPPCARAAEPARIEVRKVRGRGKRIMPPTIPDGEFC